MLEEATGGTGSEAHGGVGGKLPHGCPVVTKAYSPTRSPVTLLLDSYNKFNLECLRGVLGEFLHGRGPRKEVLGRFGNATTRGVSDKQYPGAMTSRSRYPRGSIAFHHHATARSSHCIPRQLSLSERKAFALKQYLNCPHNV